METELEQCLIFFGKYCYFADNLKRLLSISLRCFSLPFKQPINAEEKSILLAPIKFTLMLNSFSCKQFQKPSQTLTRAIKIQSILTCQGLSPSWRSYRLKACSCLAQELDSTLLPLVNGSCQVNPN